MSSAELTSPSVNATFSPAAQRWQSLCDQAQKRLDSSPYWHVRAVTCDVRDGVLTLRGSVPNFYQKQIIQQAVISLEGIRRIDNQVRVP